MATDHFEKHFHQNNSQDWNFNIIFNQPDVARMAKDYAQTLDHPGLYRPIPAQWLHSTILRVGLTTDYTEAEMMAVVEILQPKLARLGLGEFVFDSWWLWGGNVVLHITPEEGLNQIYEEVTKAVEAVVGSDRTPKSSFIPHMTLAYTKTHHNEGEINQQLVAHPVKPARFMVPQLLLLKQWPTAGHYEWEVIKSINIGQQ